MFFLATKFETSVNTNFITTSESNFGDFRKRQNSHQPKNLISKKSKFVPSEKIQNRTQNGKILSKKIKIRIKNKNSEPKTPNAKFRF